MRFKSAHYQNAVPQKVDHVQLKQKNLSMDVTEPVKDGMAEKNESS